MKIKTHALSRNDSQLKIYFSKEQLFVELFDVIIKNLHLKDWDPFRYQEETDEIKISNLLDLKDQLLDYKDEHLSIQLFLGDKKIIFVLHSDSKVQQQVLDKIESYLDW